MSSRLLNGGEHMTTEHTVVSFRQIKKKAVQFKSGRPLGNYRDPCLQYPRVSSDTPASQLSRPSHPACASTPLAMAIMASRCSCGLLRHDHNEMAHKQMAHVLWQQRCLEVASRLHHVGVVDETRRTYRHHGRQRDAPRRIATFRHATLRVAPHRYATLEPLGKPGGSRV